MKIKILLVGLLINTACFANCPQHDTVKYTCTDDGFGHTHCSWNPVGGWYEGSAAPDGVTIPVGASASQFLRAFWAPYVRVVPPGQIMYGMTICQYRYNQTLITLVQQDRDVTIPDPRLRNPGLWVLSPWQSAEGYSCVVGEKPCAFDYGEQ